VGSTKWRRAFFTACLLSIAPVAALAQPHTIVALSHSDSTAYEVDPVSGKMLNKFTAVNQPHEGVATADGKLSRPTEARSNRRT